MEFELINFLSKNFKKKFFLFFLLICSFFIFFYFFNKKKTIKEKNEFLFCSIRGKLNVKKFGADGKYTEEFQRIRLINFLLKKKIKKEQIKLEHSIRLGSKGKNSLRIDLLVSDFKNKKKIIIVVEVKKSYNYKEKKNAIQYQLLPAMSLMDCPVGIYFDGSENSCYFIRKKDGTIIEKSNSFF